MEIKIKNIGPIENASISLEKVNIIAGGNDSGKSTIGKVLFSALKSKDNNSLDFLIRTIMRRIYPSLTEEFQLILENSVGYSRDSQQVEDDTEHFIFEFANVMSINDISDMSIEQKKQLVDCVNELKTKTALSESILHEYDHYYKIYGNSKLFKEAMINDTLNFEYSGVVGNVKTAEEKFLSIQDSSVNIIMEGNKLLEYENSKYDNIIYYDSSQEIFSNERLHRFIRFGGYEDFSNNRKEELISMINKKNRENISIYNTEINQVLKKFVTNTCNIGSLEQGRYSVEGIELPVSTIASGTKNLLGLKQIIENGHMSKSTLLIIDEPEQALHPIWQVGYAEILKEISDEFEIDIVIVTHSNYFIEAMQKIFSNPKLYYVSRDSEGFTKYENYTDDYEYVFDSLGSAYDIIDRF